MNEIYLNHPNFGLLYSLCRLDRDHALYTTLYAQRLFFIVASLEDGLNFDSISRQEAKVKVENRLRELRRTGTSQEIQQLQAIYKQTFQ
ncbi:transcriptional coactivator PipX [Lyngbya confervoides]|nr:PipX family protein [Lyngbya confervoides]